MLERKYEPTLPYRFVLYGRMSDPKQNKRSPDQQFATVEETRARCGHPWVHVATYRDDAISGRYLRKRPGFQRMLRDIEAGLIQIDLIVVDTLERLGRAEEIAERRRKLFVEYGILIVAADNGFCDPTGVVGKAVGMVEQIRSTENTRISRHNVLRGKKDAARRRRWPGGSPPFAYRLKKAVDESVSPPEVYSVLESEPRESVALCLAFERAAETGHGDLRLSQWWNTCPEIPAEFKPISPFTMGYRLRNRIYVGELVWGAHRTGVVNDTRVIEPNPDGAEVISDFCPPLVGVELFDRVQQLRRARGSAIRECRRQAADQVPPKLIAPQARGMTLKYLLSGLVRCAECNSSMRAMPSGRRSRDGKRYVYYACPRHSDGACANRHYVPEDQLREAVLARLRARLFPPPDADGQAPPWLPELMQMVQLELWRFSDEEPDRVAAMEQELEGIDRQLAGWTMTLGDPSLPAVVRGDVVAQYERAKGRRQELEQRAAAGRALCDHVGRMLDPGEVIAQLKMLAEVLAGFNPTLGNLELSRHIDTIVCHPDGRVEMRGTLLGLLEGAVELLSRHEPEPTAAQGSPSGGNHNLVVPRRRGRLHIPDLAADSPALGCNADTVLDPERFARLPEPFFWTEVVVLPRKPTWAEENAGEVARLRATMTMQDLAAHFGKSVPTIRSALRRAEDADQAVKELPKKMPRRCWAADNASAVAALQAEGMSIMDIAKRFGKSDTTIRSALKIAKLAASAASVAEGHDSRDETPQDEAKGGNQQAAN
jgi:DNA invertase Pin-like site-specific DNA recombinase